MRQAGLGNGGVDLSTVYPARQKLMELQDNFPHLRCSGKRYVSDSRRQRQLDLSTPEAVPRPGLGTRGCRR